MRKSLEIAPGRVRVGALVRLVLAATVALALGAGCVGDGGEDGAGESGFDDDFGAGGKADVTVGPIVSMRCRPDATFVRRGGVVRMEVDAPDATGAQSRNYELHVEPATSARVVQRSRVIFDQDGIYTVVCKSRDSAQEDRTAVSVGEEAPALAVNAPGVLLGTSVAIVGRATAIDGGTPTVTVDGSPVSVDTEGAFNVELPLGSGIQRHDVVATDAAGQTSQRRVWAMGGPYGDLNNVPADVVRVSVGAGAYPDLAGLVVGRVHSLMQEDSFREGVFGPHEGRAVGYDWKFEGNDIGLATVTIELKPHPRGVDVHARIDGLFVTGVLHTNGLFSNTWSNQGFRGDIDYLEIDALLEFAGMQPASAQDVEVRIGDLEIDLTESWAITENILESVLDGQITKMIGEGIRQQSGELVSEVAQGLERSIDITLPAPVAAPGVLQLETKLTSLVANQQGVQMGLALGFDGETDPLRLATPGPFTEPASGNPLPAAGTYEVGVDQSVFNNLLFAIWQTGQMDFDITVPAATIATDEPGAPVLGDIDVFVTPQMPPVVQMLGADRLLITVGDLRVDGVLDAEVGAANVSIAVGAEVEVILKAGDTALEVQATTGDVTLDVLVPPAGLEKEGTRRWGTRLVEQEVLPKIADLLTSLDYPVSDLSGKGLGVDRLRVGRATIPTGVPSGAVIVSGELVFE